MPDLNKRKLWILAALSDGPKHGYAIARWVREQSNGDINFSAATLYQNIQSLLEMDLIQKDGEQEVEPGRRRMVYSIKQNGTRVLREHTRDAPGIGGLAWGLS